MKKTFNHVGIPTTESKTGEVYSADMKLHLTDFANSEHNIEWLRFDADCGMPREIQEHTHVAYVVENLEEAIAGQKVILDPCPVNDTLRIAFIVDSEGCPIEFMEFSGEATGTAY
ncbi:MAG: hypothetical protein K9M45_01405 [Kiritimatiellales bacterium]|nr:hypothetical protein [Kiritimatiellales bacterium]